jgi:hypothetical protein
LPAGVWPEVSLAGRTIVGAGRAASKTVTFPLVSPPLVREVNPRHSYSVSDLLTHSRPFRISIR